MDQITKIPSSQNNPHDEYSVHTVEEKIITTKDKRQIKRNIIKLLIWLILLFMSGLYLQSHPAEKVSMFSVFEVLYQKTEIFFQSTFGTHGETLERKYSMEKYYKELVKMAENNKCLDVGVVHDIEKLYESLKKEKNRNLESVLPEYTKKAYEYDNLVKDNSC